MEREKSFYQFGPFSLDAVDRVLLRGGRLVPLPAKALSTLLVLVRNQGHVVDKDTLMNEVWPDESVEEGNLAQSVFKLRKALGEVTENPTYIETVPRRGYRFLGAVKEISAPEIPATSIEQSLMSGGPTVGRVASQPQLVGEEQPRQDTENSAAYRSYMKGRYYWSKFTFAALEKAIECFRHAVDLDPTYAMAYVGIADSYIRLGASDLSPAKITPRAKEAVLAALQIDEELAEAHATLGKLRMDYEWDWAGAEQEYRRALELKPNYATAHLWYGSYLQSIGKLDEALVEQKRALELDPLSFHINASIASTLWLAHRCDESLARIHETLEMDRNFLPAQILLGWVFEMEGNFSESVATMERAREIDDSPFILAYLGRAYAVAGSEDKARVIIAALQEHSARRYVSPYSIALIMEGFGAVDSAFEWLEKAYEDQDVWLSWIRVDPRLARLKSDARFKDLERRIFSPRAKHSATKRHTENSAAYESYLEGRRRVSDHSREGMEQATVCFQRAIELDPDYALAHAAIVDSFLRLATNYLPPTGTLPRPSSTKQLDSAAMVELRCEWDLNAMERELERARELKSTYPAAHQWHYAYLFSRNLYHQALKPQKARDVGPVVKDDSGTSSEHELDLFPSGTLTPTEEVQVLCIVAREQIHVGNFDAARAALKSWWTFGRWPKLAGLSLISSADLLLTVGTLASNLASTAPVQKGQKHAEELLNGAIALCEQFGSALLAAEGRIALADCYFREGIFDLARTTLLTTLESLPRKARELRTLGLMRLATFACFSGRLRDSLRLFDEIAEIVTLVRPRATGGFHMEMATALRELAAAENNRSHLDTAMTHYQPALHEFRALGNYRCVAIVENNHGYDLLMLKRYDEAEGHLLCAQKLFERFADNVRRAQVDDTLARLHLAAERFGPAEYSIAQAVKSLEASGREALFAEALTTQGVVLCKVRRYREAKRVLDRAYQVAERCGDGEGAGSALLIVIEEMCEQLEDDERLEIGARLNQFLASSQKASTLERLRRCQELIATAHASYEAQPDQHIER